MKVLIVDDDYLVRVGLKTIINWEDYGLKVVGEASDGSKALELIVELNPDIVITDMKMPVMDGLELMRRISTLAPKPQVIVLSSYDDFHMVKEAMRLGAKDYLLKLEMDPDNLISLIGRIAREIEETEQQVGRQQRIDNQIRLNLNVLRKKFLRDLLNHFYSNEQGLQETMASLDIRLDGEYVYCFMIKVDELYRFDDVADEDLHILNFSIINIVEEIAHRDFFGYCFEGKTGEFYLLASHRKNPEAPIDQVWLVELGRRLSETLEQYLNVTAKIGIGEGRRGLKGIQNAYRKAIRAMKFRFFSENERVILWKEVKDVSAQTNHYSILSLREKLHKAILYYRKEALEGIIDTILADMSRLKLSKQSISSIVMEMFFIISEYLEMYEEDARTVLKKSYGTFQQLVRIESFQGAKSWLEHVREDLLAYIGKGDEWTCQRSIARARKYMEDNFNRELTLKEVADTINLTPSYFTTLLKRYTGQSYSEYITHIRIEKAKQLLEMSDGKVYEIGEQVGYQNVYYFNRVFKKMTGLSPGEYKKEASKG